MWFIVNTDKFHEERTRQFLSTAYPGIIKQVYLPMCRMKYTSDEQERVRFQPLIYGMLFIKADNARKLKRILTPWGYFFYEEEARNLITGEKEKNTVVYGAHLLCHNMKDLDQATIIKNATIPDEDMERFIYYSDKIADGIEGLSIVDKRYSDLIIVNDTIRILSGPLKGWVGVVKQIKCKGKKDRHLLVRFGSNHCLNISNIRQYDMQIEHEATAGPKAEAVGAWRAIDQLIGYLQAQEPDKSAPETLRALFKKYQKRLTVRRTPQLSDIGYLKKKDCEKTAWQNAVLDEIDESMRNNFRILANYFHADPSTLDQGLRQLIPDATLRPFLTPTPGVALPEDQDYAVLPHNGIVELILRCNLRNTFQAQVQDTTADEDYEYYAHLALLCTPEGKVKAITSWGGFYDYYDAQSETEREKFLSDLEAKNYPRLHHLLTQSPFRFERVQDIGGFSIDIPVDHTADPQTLAADVHHYITLHPDFLAQLTAAAVEMWQGARLLVWRQLLQRHVLLHKVPVTDQTAEP